MLGSCKEIVIVLKQRRDDRGQGIQAVEETTVISIRRRDIVQIHVTTGFDIRHPARFDTPEFPPCDGVGVISFRELSLKASVGSPSIVTFGSTFCRGLKQEI